MLPTRIDQTEQGIGRLITCLREKENIEKLLEIYLIECQEIEDASIEFAEQKNISIATGVWLDYTGGIVGVLRLGQSDAEYRTSILLKIQINTADGTPDTITSLVRQFTGANDVRLRDFTVAASTLYTNGSGNLEQPLFELIDQIKPVGVRIIIHTDREDNAVLPSWEVDLPLVEFLEVTDPLTPPTLVILDLFDGFDLDPMSVVTGLGGTYYRPDLTRSLPYWEIVQPLEGVTGGGSVEITVVINSVEVPMELFTSNINAQAPLCWEVVDSSLLIAY